METIRYNPYNPTQITDISQNQIMMIYGLLIISAIAFIGVGTYNLISYF